ncbi:MAG: hypothetical protein A2293_06680 [Elusimicrobia bacterium RIFOXYB2_FULL_49_7]|nr:MAG: hypothetical protein A2293_06680 [Elusimicrobia bacterium RIFOXYB2_FULL_49_7]
MENITLRELISAINGQFVIGDPHSTIRGISIDTRTIHRGDFYFAITGKNFDGHNFVKQALEKGASGIVITRHDIDLGNPFPAMPAVVKVADTFSALGNLAKYYRRKWQIPVVGITGSNGKTTTKEMIASILGQKGQLLKTEGNLNNQLGLPLTLLKMTGQDYCAVVEMGTSFPGEIQRLADIACPSIAIVTNIGMAHLERFQDQEGVFNEKKMLYAGLPPDGCAIVNVDDPYLTRLTSSLPCEVITIGIEHDAIVRAFKVDLWPGKPQFELKIENESISVSLPIHGQFNVYNALAAAAVGWKMGFDLLQIKNGLEAFQSAGMRMEAKTLVSGVTVINDAYNANPSSMRESLTSLVHSFPEKDKIVVLADMLELGEQSELQHQKLGEFIASQPFAKVFLFGPQMEHALRALYSLNVKHFLNREKLETEIKQSVTPGSIVFFKGSRGMRLEDTLQRLFAEDKI